VYVVSNGVSYDFLTIEVARGTIKVEEHCRV